VLKALPGSGRVSHASRRSHDLSNTCLTPIGTSRGDFSIVAGVSAICRTRSRGALGNAVRAIRETVPTSSFGCVASREAFRELNPPGSGRRSLPKITQAIIDTGDQPMITLSAAQWHALR
jgi:hypothetical protein